MHLQRQKDAIAKYEYGCDLRRLYPWDSVADPVWGSAIASVRPGESTTPHGHDELETFIVLSGNGVITIESETAILEQGDVVFIPRNHEHCFLNTSTVESLVFMTIYWDSPESREKMKALVATDSNNDEKRAASF